jgi:ATP-binding cassette subfamily B protein
MIRAAKITGVHEMIEGLEKGYETEISEEGGNLSLGQKQLIAMARAILADPKILILDEATSSVDPLAEQAIQRALDRVMADRTSVIIAHRLATVKKADRICVLSAGQIVESGDHRTLMRKRGRYYQMVQRENETITSRRLPA